MDSLLGETLTSKSGDISTSTLISDGVVALYFSAHWCPPCQRFTPVLIDFYDKVKKSDNGAKFEVIFVSSDRDEKSFEDYYNDKNKPMPWLALPFALRDQKNSLSSKFKVQGIPTLIFLNAATGEVINKQGRDIVMSDPEGKNFPWAPKTFRQIMGENDGKLVDKSGHEFNNDNLSGKVLGLYFSAHWCPPCRGFTPALVKTYNKIVEDGKNFEIIFCSGDHDETSFKEYLNDMPWKALPFQDSREKDLSALFEVSGIPHLVIIDENDKVITDNGRSAVSSDPEGKDFPWHPQPIEELSESTAQTVNEHACLIAFTDGSPDIVNHVKTILKPQAEAEHAKGVENKEMYFFWGAEDDICSSIRDFCNIDEDPENLLILLNIPGQKIHVSKEDLATASADTIGNIITQFRDGSLETRSIR